MVVSYTELKNYLGLDDDRFQDQLMGVDGVSGVLAGAEAYVAGEIEKPLEDFDPLPADLRIVILQIAATMFRWKETIITGTIVAELPYAGKFILNKYRSSNFVG